MARASLSWFALALVAALSAAQPADAFNVISNYPRTAVFTNPETGQSEVRQDRLLSFRCDESDFGVTREFAQERANGDVGRVSVTCGRPAYTYSRSVLGHVPEDGTYNEVRLCITQNPVETDANSVASLSSPTTPSGRNARAMDASGVRRRLHSLAQVVETKARHVKSQFVVAAVAAGAIGGAAVCTFTDYCGGGGSCPDCVTEEEFAAAMEDLSAAQGEFGEALADYTSQLQALNVQNNLIDGQLAANQEATLDFVEQQLSAAINTLNVTAEISQHMRELQADVEFKFDEVDARIDVSNAISADIAQASFNADALLRADLESLANHTQVAFTQTNQAMADNAAVSRQQFARFNAMHRRVTGVVSRIVTTLEEARLRVQERSRLTDEVFSQISALPLGYTPFLRTAGQAPDPTSAAHPMVTVDETYIRAVDAAATERAHMWRLRYRCFSGYLVNNGVATLGTDALLQTLGTSECDLTNADTIRQTCRCWIEVLHQSCVAEGGGETASGFNRTGWDDGNPLTLAPGDGFCDGAVTTSSTVLRSSTEVSEYMGGGDALDRVCRSLTGDHTYVVANNYPLGKRGLASPDDSLCSNWFLSSAMYPPTESPINFLLGYLTTLRSSYTTAWLGIGELRDIVKGVLPEGMSTETNDFDTEGGLAAVCTTASFMAYGPNTLELARLDPVSVETAVTVRVECCASDGFSSEDESFTSAQVVRDIEMDNLLPGPGYLTVGNTVGTVDVFDVPQDDISVSASPASRAGTVSYAVAADASQVGNFSHWVTSNGQQPVARDGAAVADLYRTTMVPSPSGDGTFTCSTEDRTATSGTLCAVLDNFHATAISPEVIKFEPRTGSYIGTLPIPDGDVSQVIFSACPTVSFTDSTANGRTLSLQVTAALDGSTDVLVVVDTETNLCTDYAETVQVQPGAVTEVWIPRCVDPLEGAHTATVHRVTASGTVQCGSPLDVRVNATFFEEVVGLADTGHVARVVVTERDQTMVIIAQLLREVVAIATDTVVQQADTFNAMGIPLSDSFFTGQLDTARDALGTLQTLIDSNVRSDATLAFSDTDTLDQIDALIAATGGDLDAQQVQLDVLHAQVANTSAEIAQAADILANLSDARVRLNEAYDTLANQTLAIHRLTGEGLSALKENAEAGGNFLGIPGIPVAGIVGGIAGAIGDAPDAAFGVVAGGFEATIGVVEDAAGLTTAIVADGLGFAVGTIEDGADLIENIAGEVKDEVVGATGFFSRMFGEVGAWIDTILLVIAVAFLIGVGIYLKRMGLLVNPFSQKSGFSLMLASINRMTPEERRRIFSALQSTAPPPAPRAIEPARPAKRGYQPVGSSQAH